MLTAPHIHAMVIHFPIALIIIGFLSEIIALIWKNQFFKNAAFYLLLMGALGAIVAYLSGSYAGDGMTDDGMLQAPMELHEEAATITLWLAIITSLFRVALYYYKYNRAWTNWVGIVLFAALVGSVARTGYLGGQLVFQHGAGIELALPDFGNDQSE